MDANARKVAAAFVSARKSGRSLAVYPGIAPADLPSAYAIQDIAIGLWGREIGGWKVGRIGEPDASRLGSDRLVGPVFGDTIVEPTSGQAEMQVFRGGFKAAEAEFMLRLAPPQDTSLPTTNLQAADWIDEVRIGIEIASSPYPAINRDGPCVTISDHGNNAGLLLGGTVNRDRWTELASIEVSTSVDRKTVGRATVATMLDGPFGAVRFLLHNLADRGISPQKGWWISSGAITGVHEVSPGETIDATFAGIGTVTVTIA